MDRLNVSGKFERFCVYFIMSIMCMIFTYLTYVSFVRTAYMYDWEDTLFINDNVLLNAFAVILVVALGVYVLSKNINISDGFLRIFIIVVNAIMVWFILSTQLVSVDDQGEVLSAASAFLNGNYEPWNMGGYCFRWAHQNGIVLIYAFLSWIFGEGNGTVMQLLNLLFIGITFNCIYKSELLMGISRNVSKLIYISLYLFMPYMMYVTYIYGTVIGLMFATVGFYYGLRFMDTPKLKYGIITVLTMGIATVCKSNYFIFVIAFVIVYVVDIVCNSGNKDKSNDTGSIKNTITGNAAMNKIILVAAVIIICLVLRFATTAIIESNIGKKAPEGTPTILFVVMGIQEGWRAPGWCNSFDDIMYSQCNYDKALANEVGFQWFKNEAAKFLYNPDYLVRFFNRKISSLWANPTWECFEILKSRTSNTSVPGIIQKFMDVGSPINLFVTEFLDVMQTIMYFGALMYCILAIRKTKMRDLLFSLTFLGAFIFFIVWEGRCHYTVPLVTYIIPMSVIGYKMLCELVSDNIRICKEKGVKVLLKNEICPLYLTKTNIWLTIIIVAWLIGGSLMVNYAIWQEDGAYKDFLNGYTYGNRIADGSYKISPYKALNDNNLVVIGTEAIEDGTRLTLVKNSDDKANSFSIKYHFYENGLNHYYIWNDEADKMLFLRDESQMYGSSVYLQNYNLDDKHLWYFNNAGDGAYYIRNVYGMALSYNLEINQVVLMPYTADDNQKWFLN